MTTQSFFPSYEVQPERSDPGAAGGDYSGFGSYYAANYYKNPQPYDSSDRGAPVPGWGPSVSVAGPARVGVGEVKCGCQGLGATSSLTLKADPAILRKVAALRTSSSASTKYSDVSASKPLPWWIFPAASAVVLAGLGYYGVKKGWF